jgi:hypothetical protein
MHGHPCAPKHGIAAEDFRIANDKEAGPPEIPQRCRKGASWFAQIDLEQPLSRALERTTLRGGSMNEALLDLPSHLRGRLVSALESGLL